MDIMIDPYAEGAKTNGDTGGMSLATDQIANFTPSTCCCCSTDADVGQIARAMDNPSTSERLDIHKVDYAVPHVASPYSANSRKGSPAIFNIPPLDLKEIISSKEPYHESTGISQEEERVHSGRTAGDWANDQEQFANLPPLPEGWIRVRSRTSGAIYYCYTLTGETTFTEPVEGELGGEGVDLEEYDDLPPGWTEVVSRSTGQLYYWNSALQKSQFEKPTVEDMEAPPPLLQNNDLPGGWVEMKSKTTGETYYYNPRTQQSQFERPDVEDSGPDR